MTEQTTPKAQGMLRKFANWLRRLADRLAPLPAAEPERVYVGLPQQVLDLLPRANEIVQALEETPHKGPIRELIAFKLFRQERPGVPHRYLKLAINRSLVGVRGD